MKIFTGEILSNLFPEMNTPTMTSLYNRQTLTRLCSEGQPDYEDPIPNILPMILGHSYITTMKKRIMCY